MMSETPTTTTVLIQNLALWERTGLLLILPPSANYECYFLLSRPALLLPLAG